MKVLNKIELEYKLIEEMNMNDDEKDIEANQDNSVSKGEYTFFYVGVSEGTVTKAHFNSLKICFERA